MKKFLLAILSLFYLTISIGFVNYNVYCQDRLVKTAMMVNDHDCNKCSDCSKKSCAKDGSCCKHSKEHIQLKVDQNHTSHHTDITPQQVAILYTFLSGYIIPDAYTSNNETYPATNAPLLARQNSIYILLCTYLI